MQLKSKFDCNQQVWHRFIGSKKLETKCYACDGDGNIVAKNDTKQTCRECYGHGNTTEWVRDVPVVQGPLTIGNIKIEYTSYSDRDSEFVNFGRQKELTKVEYMMYESGIGSGTVYPEDRLFGTKEEAERFVEEVG